MRNMLGVLYGHWCYAELTWMLLNWLWWSIPVELAWLNAKEIGERHKSVATVVQMSLLLMNYTRAHFSSNKILNGVTRTSSPLCMTDLYKAMHLNENSLLALMKHEKHFQFTETEGAWQEGVKWQKWKVCTVSCDAFVKWRAIFLSQHQWAHHRG